MEEVKSKVFISFLMASLIILLFQVEALAVVSSTGESKATITFKMTDDGETPPRDPEDPTEPLDPTDPDNPTDEPTHNAGPLSLDYVSSIDFGVQEVNINEEKTYESISLKPFIQITDNRGTGSGWKVSAAASSFNDGTNDTLSGAVITFNNGEVVSPTGLAAPTPNQEVVLSTNGVAVDVVTAQKNTGLGTWLNRWFPTLDETRTFNMETNDNVTLKVPAGVATVGTHKATITWTLTDAPI